MIQNNPQLAQIQAKIDFLKNTHSTIREEVHSISQRYEKIKSSNKLISTETQIQKKKTNALMLLCSELQRKHDAHLFQPHVFARDLKTLQYQKEILKEELIKQGEQIELYKQLNQFLKQYISTKSKSQLTSFMDKQSQLTVKVQGKIQELRNPGLVCKRKWETLNTENQELKDRLNTLQKQSFRQQRNIKQTYEEYLDKINRYNTKLVYLNNCHDQKVISEHLIQEMSLAQRQRKGIQQEYRQLRQNLENICKQHDEAKQHRKTILQFFSDKNQQTKLANKIRVKISQLKDLAQDLKLCTNNPKILIISRTLEAIRDQHKRVKDRIQFLKSRYDDTIEGKASIEQVEVANFFNKLLASKDEKIGYQSKLNRELTIRVEQMINKKSILQQKCRNLKQCMDNSVFVQDEDISDLRSFTFNKNQLVQ